MRFLSLAACVAIAVAQSSFAQSATSTRDGSHDFDFALGSWTTEVTIIKDPFNKPNEQTHMRGTKVARPIWNGKGWIEEIGADGPDSHWQGATIFLVPKTQVVEARSAAAARHSKMRIVGVSTLHEAVQVLSVP